MSDQIIISDDYSKAYSLDKKIKANTQVLQEALFELGKNLIEMRNDKLYKELGYQNFADYCENEVGIKRTQAHSYISIAENLPEDFVRSGEQIGAKKLYLLSRLDEVARTEIVENTDLNSTTVKELKEEIKKLESEKSNSENELNEAKRRQNNLLQKNRELMNQVRELESRPVDVAVNETDNKEIFHIYFENASQSLSHLIECVRSNINNQNGNLFLERSEQMIKNISSKLTEMKGE